MQKYLTQPNLFINEEQKGHEVRTQRLTDKLWLQVYVSDLTERQELLIVALGYINHQVLRALWKLSRKEA